MSDPWKEFNDLMPAQATAYVVCLDCGHSYTEALRSPPGPCPACNSTKNRDQFEALTAGSARGPELDPEDQLAHDAALAAVNNLPAPVVRIAKPTYVGGSRMINVVTPLAEVRKALAKAYVAFARQPNPPPFYINRDELHLDEITRLATETESSALNAAFSQNDMASAEKVILGVLDRALPGCPKCGGFAYRVAAGLKCGRCGIVGMAVE